MAHEKGNSGRLRVVTLSHSVQVNAGGGKVVGIVGGLGPETTAKFFDDLNSRFRKLASVNPSVVVDNVRMPLLEERKLVRGSKSRKVLGLLEDSVMRLNATDANFIVIPCNTVHVFIEELRQVSEIQILSITEETARALAERGIHKVGLLATNGTVKNKVFEKSLSERKITAVLPNGEEQATITNTILNILNGNSGIIDRMNIDIIRNRLIERGAEAVILACTDLQLIANNDESEIETIDTLKVLEDAVLREMQDKNDAK